MFTQGKLNSSLKGLKGNLLSNGSWTVVNQFGNLLISFLVMVLMRNWLGEEDAGTFTAGFSYAFLLSQIAIFGFDNLSIREITKHLNKNDWSTVKSYHRFTNLIVWSFSVILTLIACVYSYLYVKENALYYILSFLTTPFLTMLMLNQFKVLGLGFVNLAQSPEKLLRPGLFLLSIVIVHTVIPDRETLITILCINVVLFIATWFISDINFKRKANFNTSQQTKISRSSQSNEKRRKWLYAAGGLFVYSVIGHLNGKIDIMMLDDMASDNASISYYNSAHRFAGFVAFGTLIVNQLMGPVVSTYFKSNERKKLSKIVAKSSFFSLLIGLAVFAFYILFGDWMLNFLFSRSIPEEYEVLMITSLGYFFQVIAGSAAYLLIMDSKTSKFASISIAIGLILNALFNYFLIPTMGITGAAWGTTISLLAWCILMIIFSIRKTKINPTCFGISLFR